MIPTYCDDRANSTTVAYSVVVPCYQSGRWLDELVARIKGVISETDEVYEIILVNDASPDDTWQTAARLAEENDFVTSIDLLHNSGQVLATLCGLKHARGELIITMDDDLQHPPEAIPQLLQAMAENPDWDCAFGAYIDKKHHFVRNLGSRLWKVISDRLYGFSSDLERTGFRIMRRKVAEAVCRAESAHSAINLALVHNSQQAGHVRVDHHARQYGSSGYTWTKLMTIVLDGFLAASAPAWTAMALRTASVLAIAFLFVWFLVPYLLTFVQAQASTTIVPLLVLVSAAAFLLVRTSGYLMGKVWKQLKTPKQYQVRCVTGRTSGQRSGSSTPQPL